MANLDDIAALLQEQPGRPPVHSWNPELSGEIDIVITADGRWFHEGGEIRRHELVKLFASILRREADGCHYLVTPVEKWRIRVEDQPLVIVDMEAAEGRLILKTNTDNWVPVNAEHPLTVVTDPDTGEPYPTLSLDNGLTAKIGRSVFYRLVELAQADGDTLVLWSDGERFSLGSLSGSA